MSSNSLHIVIYVFGVIGALWCLKRLLMVSKGIYKYFIRCNSNMYAKYGKNTQDSKDKSWVAITGATGSLGYSYAKEFAKQGFNIIFIARNPDKTNKKLSSFHKLFPNTQTAVLKCDLNSLSDINSVDTLKNEMKNILANKDVSMLINVAAADYHGSKFSDSNVNDNIFQLRVNIIACVVLAQLFIPYFEERNKNNNNNRLRSCIVNIGSGAALMTMPGISVYGGTKAFLHYWSVTASQEYKKHNIDITCLNPMAMASEMSGFKNNGCDIITTDKYAYSSLKHIGNERDSYGYWLHAMQGNMMRKMPREILLPFGQNIMMPYLFKKQENAKQEREQAREQAKQQQTESQTNSKDVGINIV